MKIKWYHKVAAWAEVIFLILIYGLEGAKNKIDAKLTEAKRKLYAITN